MERGPDYADVPITTDPQILPTDLGAGHDVDVSFAPTLPGRYYILVCAKDGHVHIDRDHREQPTLVDGTTLCIPEVTVLEPSGTIGGKIPVRVQVKSCGACADYLIVEEHEETTAHGWEWRTIGIGTGSQGVESEEEVDGIRTRVYRFDWDTTQVHNGAHIIRARARGNPSDYYRGTTHSVNVMNLTITSVTPDDHIAWDGETPPQPITVTIEDDDLTDPTEVTLTLHNAGLRAARCND